MRGRPPKPTALKLVAGNPGKRKTQNREPEPKLLNDLAAPAHLDERARAVWQELAPILRSNQVLTEMDSLAFELLCGQVADYRHMRHLRADDYVDKSPKTGSLSMGAMHLVMQSARKGAETLLSRFGMDPVARSRVLLDPQGDLFADPKERFF